MYVLIRRYKADPGVVDEAVRRVRSGLVPLLSQSIGFISYDVFADDIGVVSVSLFGDRSTAEAAQSLAREWVKANMGDLVPNSPEVMGGEILIHNRAQLPIHGVPEHTVQQGSASA